MLVYGRNVAKEILGKNKKVEKLYMKFNKYEKEIRK